MHAVDAGAYGAIAAVAFGLVEVVKRLVDKRNGGRHVLSSDERRAIFDTARSVRTLEQIAGTQTEILSELKTTLAVLSDRQQRAGG